VLRKRGSTKGKKSGWIVVCKDRKEHKVAKDLREATEGQRKVRCGWKGR
jgi:hypothetical protein